MADPRRRDDELERLSNLEEEVRRLKLHNWGEGSPGADETHVWCRLRNASLSFVDVGSGAFLYPWLFVDGLTGGFEGADPMGTGYGPGGLDPMGTHIVVPTAGLYLFEMQMEVTFTFSGSPTAGTVWQPQARIWTTDADGTNHDYRDAEGLAVVGKTFMLNIGGLCYFDPGDLGSEPDAIALFITPDGYSDAPGTVTGISVTGNSPTLHLVRITTSTPAP